MRGRWEGGLVGRQGVSMFLVKLGLCLSSALCLVGGLLRFESGLHPSDDRFIGGVSLDEGLVNELLGSG